MLFEIPPITNNPIKFSIILIFLRNILLNLCMARGSNSITLSLVFMHINYALLFWFFTCAFSQNIDGGIFHWGIIPSEILFSTLTRVICFECLFIKKDSFFSNADVVFPNFKFICFISIFPPWFCNISQPINLTLILRKVKTISKKDFSS